MRQQIIQLLFIITIVIAILFLAGTANAWYDSNYSYRRELTIENTKVATTSPSYVVVASTTQSYLKTSDNGGKTEDDNGYDIIFVDDDDTTLLNFEYEYYSSTTGALVAWIETDISSTTDKNIYMYYGYSGASDISHATTTWADSGAAGVWHLSEDPTGGAGYEIFDSTDNDNDCDSGGSMTEADQVPGQLDGSLEFDGNDYLDGPVFGQSHTQGTISAWIKTEAEDVTIFSLYDTGSGTYTNLCMFYFKPGGYLSMRCRVAGGYQESTDEAFNDGLWHHVVVTYDGSGISDHYLFYVDGALEDDGIIDNDESIKWFNTLGSLDKFSIGSFMANTTRYYFFDGGLDEVRVYDKALSQADITTIYNMESDNSSFLTFGNEESDSSSGVSAQFTISAWVRPTNSITSKALAVKDDEIRLVTDASGNSVCQIHNGTAWQVAATSSTALTVGRWSYVSCVYDRTDIRIYIDGVLQATQAMSAVDINDTGNALNLGYDAGNDYNYFQGYIDEFKYYNYARTAGQVKAGYTAPATSRGGSVRTVTVGEGIDQSEGLIAHWKFDETALNACGTANDACDATGNNNHLSAINDAAPTSTAKYGYAATFDGTGDYYCSDPDNDGDCDDDDDLDMGTSDFTIEAWVNLVDDGNNQYIIDDGSGGAAANRYIIAANTNDKLSVWNDNSWFVTSNTSIKDGSWHHIVVSRLSGIVYLYIDGVFDSSAINNADWTNSNSFVIGARGDGGDYFMDGQIDDVKIYNVARSASQIRKDYETGPPPVAHWKFDENIGDTAYDTSGANDGDLAAAGGSCPGAVACPTWTSGQYGSALQFDGVDDYVDAPVFPILTGSVTFSVWYKYQWKSGWQSLVDNSNAADPTQGGRLGIYHSSTENRSRFEFYVGGEGGSVSAVSNYIVGIVPDTWFFVVGVNDKNGNMKLWVNNVLMDSDVGKNMVASENELRIGKGGWTSRYVTGLIDDVRIYNYARTQKQIMEDMNAGHPAVGSPVGSYVGYWKFDEGYASTTYDQSVNSNDGTLTGGVKWTTDGKFGSALSFDGENDYVSTVVNLWSANGNRTFSAWVKFNTVSGESMIFETSGQGQFYRTGSKIMVHPAGSNYWRSADILLVDTWYHITFVQTSTSRRLFVNGVEETEDYTVGSPHTIDWKTPDGTLRLGYTGNVWERGYFNGLIDEVKIYPFALTPEEVKQEYNSGATLKLGSLSAPPSNGAGAGTSTDSASIAYCVPGSTDQCDPPVAHWKFDEKGGSTIYDTAGSNDGDLNLDSSPATSSAWQDADACHSGSCLSFDGVDDYVDAGSDTSLELNTGDLTISMWINALDQPTAGRIIFKVGTAGGLEGYNLAVRIDGYLIGYIAKGGTPKSVAANRTHLENIGWHYVVMTVDRDSSTGLKLYVDGVEESYSVQEDPTTISGDISDGTELNIGRNRLQPENSYFNGKIDDVRIYDYARTPAQIAWEYNRGAPIAWYKMDEGQDTATTCDATVSTVLDYSGNANHGDLNLDSSPATSSAWTEGKYSCALDFDGTDDYVEIATFSNDPMPSGNYSISIWVDVDSLPTSGKFMSFIERYGTIASAGRGWDFRLYNNSGTQRIDWVANGTGGNNGLITNYTLPTDQWVNLIITADSSNFRLYIDGILKNSGAISSNLTTPDDDEMTIGAFYYGGSYSRHTDGKIDDVRIYNYALTETQIKNVYNEGSAVRFGPSEGLP